MHHCQGETTDLKGNNVRVCGGVFAGIQLPIACQCTEVQERGLAWTNNCCHGFFLCSEALCGGRGRLFPPCDKREWNQTELQ